MGAWPSTSPATPQADQVLDRRPVRAAGRDDARPAVPDGARVPRARPRCWTGSAPSTRPRSRPPTPRSSRRCAPRRRRSTGSRARWPRGSRRWPRIVEEQYDGHTERLWTEAADGRGAAARVRRCRASASRRRRSSSPCSPSSSASARRAGRRPSATTPRPGYRSVADVVDADVAAEGARLQEGRRRPRPRRAG